MIGVHLKPISKVITQMDNIEVGILFGANFMKALEPMGIISSRNGGPYAYRTNLGWCIVGPTTTACGNDGSVKCHRIAVKDVASEKMAPHHFVLNDESKIEDADIKEMLEGMYYSDFCECNHLQVDSILDNIEDISREDFFYPQKRMGHIMNYLYSGILAFNSLTTETKPLKEYII